MNWFPGLRYLVCLLLVPALYGSAYAEVFVHDMVALTREEVLIKVETKSGYFSKGGQTVEFSINGKSAGKCPFRRGRYWLQDFQIRKAGDVYGLCAI